jgi:hypothetical protein
LQCESSISKQLRLLRLSSSAAERKYWENCIVRLLYIYIHHTFKKTISNYWFINYLTATKLNCNWTTSLLQTVLLRAAVKQWIIIVQATKQIETSSSGIQNTRH